MLKNCLKLKLKQRTSKVCDCREVHPSVRQLLPILSSTLLHCHSNPITLTTNAINACATTNLAYLLKTTRVRILSLYLNFMSTALLFITDLHMRLHHNLHQIKNRRQIDS